MSFIVTAFAFLSIFSVLVLIHEGGHYFAAKLSGIKVEEFGMGLPPRIWGKRKGETIYSINLIPFGGFVRLLGESGSDPKILKNKASFAAKSARARIFVVSAGVMMNYLLAVFLLTIGFIVGIEPMVVDYNDFLKVIDDGTYVMDYGVVVEKVTEGGVAEQNGIQSGDRIVSLNGQKFFSGEQINTFIEGERTDSSVIEIDNNGERRRVELGAGGDLGMQTFSIHSFWRLVIADVKEDSPAFNAGLKSGDIIMKINDRNIYDFPDYFEEKLVNDNVRYTVLRDSRLLGFNVEYPTQDNLIVTRVYEGTPAFGSGLEIGDILLSVDGKAVKKSNELVEIAKKSIGKSISYKVSRNGQALDFELVPDKDGLIGVGLSNVDSYSNDDLSLYDTIFQESLIEVKDVKYPFWEAPFKAASECSRLAVLTVDMAGGLFKSLATKLKVPDGVAGPVGIAQLTHTFVQQGVWPLLRFMALLSLSLAIINILPLPALDGGRLFFILIEVLSGRRINQRFESMIHAIGFMLLMLLILFVSYNDILRFF